MTNTLAESQRLLHLNQLDQLFIANISSFASDGRVYVIRRGASVVEGPYPTFGSLGSSSNGFTYNKAVLVARVATGYVVLGFVNANIGPTYVTSSPYTVNPAESLLLVESASPVTVNLYTAAGNDGRRVYVKQVGAGAVTIDGFGTETIDGAPTYVTKRYNCIELLAQDDGFGTYRWHII